MKQASGLDFALMAERLSKAPIVGIGETTHGTHEFFSAKTEIFKCLVQTYRFNMLFLESTDSGCEALSGYIETGNGDPKKLIQGLFYVYQTQEIMDLILWLREHYK